MKYLRVFLNIAHLGCNPNKFMSSFKHSPQVFLPLPTHLTLLPPHFYRQTPNHPQLSAPNVQTTSICHASQHQPHSEHLEDYKSTLCLLSFNDTPHIHLTVHLLDLNFSIFTVKFNVRYYIRFASNEIFEFDGVGERDGDGFPWIVAAGRELPERRRNARYPCHSYPHR